MRFPNFRTPRRYWQRSDGVTPPDSGRGRREWILGRSLCHYSSFVLPAGLSQVKREAALRLKVLEWSPFQDPGMLVDWHADRAGVWVWDRQAIDDAIRAAGETPRRIRVLPDSTIVEPATDGVRLVAGLEGLEGQVWRNETLIASRWWPSSPNGSEWLRFQRAASVHGEEIRAQPPAPVTPEVRAVPWVRSAGLGLARIYEIGPVRLAAAAGTVLLLPILYHGATLAKVVGAAGRAEAELVRAREDAAPVAIARGAALADLDCVDALLARVGGQLPANGTALGDWTFQNGDLRFTLTNQAPLDASFFVRLFEASHLFERVTAEPSGDGRLLTVVAKVKPSWR
jgi:hypothetical protein